MTAHVVTWYPLTLAGTKRWTIKVKATLHRRERGEPAFGVQVFQNAVGPVAAPYRPAPARVVVVSVKYS